MTDHGNQAEVFGLTRAVQGLCKCQEVPTGLGYYEGSSDSSKLVIRSLLGTKEAKVACQV